MHIKRIMTRCPINKNTHLNTPTKQPAANPNIHAHPVLQQPTHTAQPTRHSNNSARLLDNGVQLNLSITHPSFRPIMLTDQTNMRPCTRTMRTQTTHIHS
jgi:hypothetical protein